jgi:multidrug efflux pump subunit AcrA (membrane-fusion protein)
LRSAGRGGFPQDRPQGPEDTEGPSKVPIQRIRFLSVATAAAVALAGLALLPVSASFAEPAAEPATNGGVSSLGRIEPRHGIIRVGIPSTPQAISGSVVGRLLVEAGDDVKAGQVLA